MSMFRSDIRAYTQRELRSGASRCCTGEVVASVEPTRVTLKSGTVIDAHTLIWGAGLTANPIVETLGVELQHGDRAPGRARSQRRRSSRGVRRRRHRVDHRRQDATRCSRSSARSRSRPASTPARASPGCVAGKATEPFRYHDKGTMATIGRGAAVVQTHGGHTMKGRPRALAWGAVHLALLSTGEDRAKAVVDWTWAGFTPRTARPHHGAEPTRTLTSERSRHGDTRNRRGTAPADVFVIFGITGDLAKVMTFRSLYRLERRGLLDCPIVGVAVDDLTEDQLRERARDAIVGTGEDARRGGVRPVRRAALLRARATSPTRPPTSASARPSRARSTPVFYLEIPPFLFGTVVAGLADAGLTGAARVVVEKPFGHDQASATRARRRAARVPGRVADLPDRPLPREDGPRGAALPPLRQHDARAGLEPGPPRLRADHDGRELRRRGSRPLLRPGRRAAGRRGQPHACRWSRRRPWRPPPAATPTTIKDAQLAVFRAVADGRPRALRPRPVRRATSTPRASPPDSTTETYAALRLDIDNWRWSGVPFFIRTGKHLSATQTEVRLVFDRPPKLGFGIVATPAPSPTSSSSSSTRPPASGSSSTPGAR